MTDTSELVERLENECCCEPDQGFEPCGACKDLAVIESLTARLAAAEKDAERLDFLDSQRRWGDCFTFERLDSGDVYVRPWRYANQSLPWGSDKTKTYGDFYTAAQTIREAIDAARSEGGEHDAQVSS